MNYVIIVLSMFIYSILHQILLFLRYKNILKSCINNISIMKFHIELNDKYLLGN